jgi:hypothetical protein
MKILIKHTQWKQSAAFTLTELMVSMALFTLVIGGVIYAHINGLRMYEITRAKLGASETTRMSLALLVSEVRSAQRIAIGAGSNTTFAEVGDGTNQQGNAIQIYRANYHAVNNSNAWVRYYRDTSTSMLMRKPGPSANPQMMAEYITNANVFYATDYTGTNLLSNNDNNAVIGVTLQFFNLRYPNVAIGTNKFFEYFQVTSRITRRSI